MYWSRFWAQMNQDRACNHSQLEEVRHTRSLALPPMIATCGDSDLLIISASSRGAPWCIRSMTHLLTAQRIHTICARATLESMRLNRSLSMARPHVSSFPCTRTRSLTGAFWPTKFCLTRFETRLFHSPPVWPSPMWRATSRTIASPGFGPRLSSKRRPWDAPSPPEACWRRWQSGGRGREEGKSKWQHPFGKARHLRGFIASIFAAAGVSAYMHTRSASMNQAMAGEVQGLGKSGVGEGRAAHHPTATSNLLPTRR